MSVEQIRRSSELSHLIAALAAERFSGAAIYSYLRLRKFPVSSVSVVYYHQTVHNDRAMRDIRNDTHTLAKVHTRLKREQHQQASNYAHPPISRRRSRVA